MFLWRPHSPSEPKRDFVPAATAIVNSTSSAPFRHPRLSSRVFFCVARHGVELSLVGGGPKGIELAGESDEEDSYCDTSVAGGRRGGVAGIGQLVLPAGRRSEPEHRLSAEPHTERSSNPLWSGSATACIRTRVSVAVLRDMSGQDGVWRERRTPRHDRDGGRRLASRRIAARRRQVDRGGCEPADQRDGPRRRADSVVGRGDGAA